MIPPRASPGAHCAEGSKACVTAAVLTQQVPDGWGAVPPDELSDTAACPQTTWLSRLHPCAPHTLAGDQGRHTQAQALPSFSEPCGLPRQPRCTPSSENSAPVHGCVLRVAGPALSPGTAPCLGTWKVSLLQEQLLWLILQVRLEWGSGPLPSPTGDQKSPLLVRQTSPRAPPLTRT